MVVLQPLEPNDIATIIRRALEDPDRGLARDSAPDSRADRPARGLVGRRRPRGSDDTEEAVLATPPAADGMRHITESTLVEALGRARHAYDRQGEDHYNLTSALIKSVRNSDGNAALYWLARMIEGGADPIFIARRLCILASEDVGLADPQAMVQAAAAAQVAHLIGLPEALFPTRPGHDLPGPERRSQTWSRPPTRPPPPMPTCPPANPFRFISATPSRRS